MEMKTSKYRKGQTQPSDERNQQKIANRPPKL